MAHHLLPHRARRVRRPRILAGGAIRRGRIAGASHPAVDPPAQARIPPSERRLHRHPRHGDDLRVRLRVAGDHLSGLAVPRARAQAAREAGRTGRAVQRIGAVHLRRRARLLRGRAAGAPVVVPVRRPVAGAADHGRGLFQLYLRDGVDVRRELRAADRDPRPRGARHRHAGVSLEIPAPRDRPHRHHRRVPHAGRHGVDDDRAVRSAVRLV